ncbi:hypothetical protein [Leptolyngbya sp. FACHB-8]|uniref:hypothetical protein n=1 Tax=unclassified Leptolyngbya TaxID=2650499 RepID=UPI0016898B49|nr:hypothetical protein [Leptolyngbya sp. FACHB-8]MBD1911261.1 hypothetical protein [Leptolyngbya sp. FACHB-8]
MLDRLIRAVTGTPPNQTFFVSGIGGGGRNRDLNHCNDCIAIRLEAAHGYTFRNHSDLASAIVLAMNTEQNPKLRQVLTTDKSLIKLLQLNQKLGNK